MPLGCVGSCMRFAGWIKMSASGARIGRTAIAKLMDMKAVVPGSQARNLSPDLHTIGDFDERYSAAHFVACSGMKHRNSL